jgi:glutamyl-tRNA synthetase
MPPSEAILFQDLIRGEISINTSDLDDQVLLKADGYPTYHLAVVVDDHLMQITHIIRAEEWINSTPKHILLYRYFGWELPAFCHVPLLRNTDKSKLSKRKNPVWSSWFLEQGYLPDAMVNHLSLMGWTHPDQKEIFSREEFISLFDLKDLKAVGPSFDLIKLEWMNGEYVRSASISNLQSAISNYLKEYDKNAYALTTDDSRLFSGSIPLIQSRIKKLSDYWPMCEFFFVRPTAQEVDMKPYTSQLQATSSKLQVVEDWNAVNIGDAMQFACDELGMKKSEYFMMMRVAIAGKKISPPLNESMELLGKEECMKRMG